MEFTVEEVSPVKKRVHVVAGGDEVKASLAAAVALIGQDLQLDGFRKGKVPASVIRQRFPDAVQKEARENLLNVHIQEVLGKLGAEPVAEIVMDGEDQPLTAGEPFKYSMEFEVVPTFDLPRYEGLEVEETESEANEGLAEALLKRILRADAKWVPVEGNGPAVDGQVAVVDFELLDEGKALGDFQGKNVEILLGVSQPLPELENLIKATPVGHTSSGTINFPEDFLVPDLAGKALEARVTVHAIKGEAPLELTDELAQAHGYKDMEDMRQRINNLSLAASRRIHRAESEQKLLDALTKQVDYQLPEGSVRRELDLLMGDHLGRMEQLGKRVSMDKENVSRLMEEMRPRAEQRAREKILLVAIARKEALEVSPKELAEAVNKAAKEAGENPQVYLQKMQENGMLSALAEHMLSDKAMDLVYERAQVKLVPPTSPEESGAEGASSAAE